MKELDDMTNDLAVLIDEQSEQLIVIEEGVEEQSHTIEGAQTKILEAIEQLKQARRKKVLIVVILAVTIFVVVVFVLLALLYFFCFDQRKCDY